MKTIEINQKDIKKNKRLIKKIYKKILYSSNSHFHFLLEPELIIRVEDKEIITAIKLYLSRRNLSYKIYDYPLANGKKYKEDKRSVMVRYSEHILPILHANSILALVSKNEKDRENITERTLHTQLNMFGKEWVEEGYLLHRLAHNRTKIEIRYGDLYGIKPYLSFINFLHKVIIKMYKLALT